MKILKAFWHWLVPVERNRKAGDIILYSDKGELNMGLPSISFIYKPVRKRKRGFWKWR